MFSNIHILSFITFRPIVNEIFYFESQVSKLPRYRFSKLGVLWGEFTPTDPIHHSIICIQNFTIIGLVFNQVLSFQE